MVSNPWSVLLIVVGGLVACSSIQWTFKHDTHQCPPMETWGDTLCPLAQKYEVYMFLQILCGLGIVVLAFAENILMAAVLK